MKVEAIHQYKGTVMHKQKGFGVVELILVFVAIGIVGFAGWFVWNSQKQLSKTLDDANKGGSAVIATKKSTASNTTSTKSVTSNNVSAYLSIPRWNVQVPVNGYVLQSLSTVDGTEEYQITTSAILAEAKTINCTDTSIGSVTKRSTPDQGGEPAVFSKQINGYYYAYHQRTQASCVDAKGNAPYKINSLQDGASTELSNAILNTKGN